MLRVMKFLQGVITQLNSHKRDFSFHFAFLLPIRLKETRSVSVIEHVLSRISNIIDGVNGKSKERNKEYDQTESVFYLKRRMQQCNS